MKLLITGSRGFVGGSVGRAAAAAGHDVLGIARSSQPEADWPGQYVQSDVLNGSLVDVLQDFAPDAVLHGAGTASVSGSLHAPLEDFQAAVLTWANLLENVRKSGVRPVILFPSSAAVYGNPSVLPVAEDAPICPVSPYGFHKAACELVAREYAECFGLNIAVCRLFSLFGPRQRRLLVCEIYHQLAGPGPEVWLQGTGGESRDYLPAEELAEILLGLAAHPALAEVPGTLSVLNIGRGQETTVADLARQMSALHGGKPVRYRGENRPGNPVRWAADVARLNALLPDRRLAPLIKSLASCINSWGITAGSL